MYYICLAGLGGWADNKCMTILPSKVWQPKSGDWMHPQGCSCTCCESNFNCSWGVIIEPMSPILKQLLYVKAEVPDEHINDARAMFHEQQFDPVSPEDLYAKVPMAYPSATSRVHPVPGKRKAHSS